MKKKKKRKHYRVYRRNYVMRNFGQQDQSKVNNYDFFF
jgi:hypothetical protein